MKIIIGLVIGIFILTVFIYRKQIFNKKRKIFEKVSNRMGLN